MDGEGMSNRNEISSSKGNQFYLPISKCINSFWDSIADWLIEFLLRCFHWLAPFFFTFFTITKATHYHICLHTTESKRGLLDFQVKM